MYVTREFHPAPAAGNWPDPCRTGNWPDPCRTGNWADPLREVQ